jgi:hypothetical protein
VVVEARQFLDLECFFFSLSRVLFPAQIISQFSFTSGQVCY